jgi:histone deacetylase complex regulatory component SIN3
MPINLPTALEKPPAPAPILPPAQAQIVPYHIDPALEFVQMVKLRFTRDIYDQFLDLLQPETVDVGSLTRLPNAR